MDSFFSCPLCGGALARDARTCRCPAGHSFDIAREGYVNLLPANQRHSKAPGDDGSMAAARTRFLDGGWYAPLRDVLCALVEQYAPAGAALLDAGCGEGWYTAGVYQALREAGRAPLMAGTDISKFALRTAAKRAKEIEFAVASSFRLPLPGAAADVLLNCFSPLALEEFRRVLKPGGWFLYVVPGPGHLWELKEILYDQPYPNEEKKTPYDGFAYQKIVPVDDMITLGSREDIQNLFHMTPYAWKTPKSGAERLAALERLTVRISFRVHVFRRTEGTQ